MSESESSTPARKSIFEYFDYREYIRHHYVTEREKNPKYSFAVLARRAGIPSRAYVKLVMDGKRGLTFKTIPKFARGLKLGKVESRYFEILVRYQHSDDSVSKNELFAQLMSLRGKSRASELTEAQHRYFANAHHPAIRECVLLSGFPSQSDRETQASWIHAHLKKRPPIGLILEALDDLTTLGLLKINEENALVQSHATVASSDGPAHATLREFHRQMISEALNRVDDPAEERHLTNVTLAIRPGDYARAVESIREFIGRFDSEFSALPGEAGQVCLLALQLFPLTRPVSPQPESKTSTDSIRSQS